MKCFTILKRDCTVLCKLYCLGILHITISYSNLLETLKYRASHGIRENSQIMMSKPNYEILIVPR